MQGVIKACWNSSTAPALNKKSNQSCGTFKKDSVYHEEKKKPTDSFLCEAKDRKKISCPKAVNLLNKQSLPRINSL